MNPDGHESAHFWHPSHESSFIRYLLPAGNFSNPPWLQYIQQLPQAMHVPHDMQRLLSATIASGAGLPALPIRGAEGYQSNLIFSGPIAGRGVDFATVVPRNRTSSASASFMP